MRERRKRQQPHDEEGPYDYRAERERWRVRRDQLIVYTAVIGLLGCAGAVIASIGETGGVIGVATVFGGLLGLPKFLEWDERGRR